ncbi:MAG TPA: SRPBCC family protein [Gaiellaceae bacterium]|nr:SRPBCC family protein [Gaiellaceae bacterium]
MAAIEQSVEIARPPDEVFAYIDDFRRHGEWQDGLVVDDVTGDGGVGTLVRERRRMGSREMTVEWEVTAKDPPHSFAFRGTGGPLRPVGRGSLESLDGGSRTRLDFSLDFEPHGIGFVLRPLARRQARKSIPRDHAKLKEILERRGD